MYSFIELYYFEIIKERIFSDLITLQLRHSECKIHSRMAPKVAQIISITDDWQLKHFNTGCELRSLPSQQNAIAFCRTFTQCSRNFFYAIV